MVNYGTKAILASGHSRGELLLKEQIEMSKTKIFTAVYALIGLVIILTPTYIAPVCCSPAMGCRANTLPTVVALGVIIIIVAIAQFIFDR